MGVGALGLHEIGFARNNGKETARLLLCAFGREFGQGVHQNEDLKLLNWNLRYKVAKYHFQSVKDKIDESRNFSVPLAACEHKSPFKIQAQGSTFN